MARSWPLKLGGDVSNGVSDTIYEKREYGRYLEE
jgi:hypothetical protein